MSPSLSTLSRPAHTLHAMPVQGNSIQTLVDLRVDADGALILSWPESPGAHNKRVTPAELNELRGLADEVSHAEMRGVSAAIVKARTALSEALVKLIDGNERALAHRIEAAESEGRRLDLVVRATTADRRNLREHPATWMRWELLPFAEMRRSGAPPLTVVLQLGPQRLLPARTLERNGLRILFMAFSPRGVPELDFEREEEELLTAVAALTEKRRARLRVIEEGTLEELKRVLQVESFDVVHLSGHGALRPEGPRLFMEDAFGAGRLVAPHELLEVLATAQQMPELVMLACCHSAEVRGSVASFAADLVAGGVPAVVGWTRPVLDDVATIAAAAVYEHLGNGKTPVEATHAARDRLRRADDRSRRPNHAWGTLHLVSRSGAGFCVDPGASPLSERNERGEVYRYLGQHMRVLGAGFVGRRRQLQRLLQIVLRGKEAQGDTTRDVAGACIVGMKGVGKSCTVGRTIERAKQHTPELQTVVIHGEIDERSVLEAFTGSISASGGDETAERLLARVDEGVFRRVQRVMEHWRRRHVVVVLDDFEQNLEPTTSGPFLLSREAAALLDVLLPVCRAGTPKLLITSTAEPALAPEHARALAFMPLGALEPTSIRKLWNRGQASNDLSSVSLQAWGALAERLGRNARILSWARSLLAGKTDAELAGVAKRAALELPVWVTGDAESEEKQAEVARLFLEHMAIAKARDAFGEDALAFVKRARVFEAAVPKEAFVGLVEGLKVDVDRDLDALASWGLLEMGELDGARAYRVSPLVEPKAKAKGSERWERAAAAAWEGLAEKATHRGWQIERVRFAWEHALRERGRGDGGSAGKAGGCRALP
ncbi:MAG: CHAT domain-containing protein [Polyangiaceae bacterium]